MEDNSAFLKAIMPFIPAELLEPRKEQPVTIIPFMPGAQPPASVIHKEAAKDKPFITGNQLRLICPHLSIDKAQIISDLYNLILPKYGLDDYGIFHEFIAEVAHESNQFADKEENLNYSAEGLLNTFAKYFTPEQARSYARKPMLIANRVYANRMGNGNEASGDGWNNRGGGDIQLTGKFIYDLYEKYCNIPKVREKVRSTDMYAIDSSCWYFCVYKSLKDEAQRNEFLKITKDINGGTNGLNSRTEFYDKAKEVLVS